MNVKKPFERNNNFRRKIKKGHRKICLIRILNLEKPRDSWKCPLHSSKIRICYFIEKCAENTHENF